MALILLACCTLLVSSFEAAKKKTDRAKKSTSTSAPSTATAATSAPHSATISPEGTVTVDEQAAASPAAGTTTTATADASAALPVVSTTKVKSPKPAVASSTSSSESVSDAAPVMYGPLILPIEHDLKGDGSWTERGTVEVTFGSGSSQRAAVKLSEVALSDAQQQQLLQLAASNGYYRVRVRGSQSYGADKPSSATTVLASNRACALVASALHESLVLHFDIHGTLLSITYTNPIAACPTAAATTLPSTSFTSRAKLSFGRTAERPQNIRVRQQPGETGLAQTEGAAAADGQPVQDAQSFFMKYVSAAQHQTRMHTRCKHSLALVRPCLIRRAAVWCVYPLSGIGCTLCRSVYSCCCRHSWVRDRRRGRVVLAMEEGSRPLPGKKAAGDICFFFS